MATYSLDIRQNDRTDQGKRIVDAQIAYTAADTYSSGLPIDLAQLGFRQVCESLSVYSAPGYAASFDGGKIRLYQQGAAAGVLTEVAGGASPVVTVKVRAIGF